MTRQPKDVVDELMGALILQRQRRKLTIERVAHKCWLTGLQLRKIEQGFTEPTARVLLHYAAAVGLKLDFVLSAADDQGEGDESTTQRR